jgi:hypothetical protein
VQVLPFLQVVLVSFFWWGSVHLEKKKNRKKANMFPVVPNSIKRPMHGEPYSPLNADFI